MADSNYTGRRIKEERKRLGLSQTALAQQINCVKTTVSRWETGSGYPDIETLEKLSCIFGVTIDSLVNEKEEYVVDNTILELKNVGKSYKRKKSKNNVTALNNIELSFGNKGIVFILGKSGSGKSTLLNLIGGLDTADQGEVLFCGQDVSKLSGKDLDEYRNHHIGFVFQEYNLFDDMTVRENIAFALDLQNKGKKDVSQLLDRFELADIADRKPCTLSGGQKQRVAIARALIKDSDIILADEPTGALDSDTAKQVMDYIRTIAKDKLVVVVSHDKNLANTYADRIIELKDGEVISDTYNQKIAETKHETSQKIKSHLSVKNVFRLGVGMFGKKRGRLAFSIIMIVLSLVVFAMADTFSAFDDKAATIKSFEKMKPEYFSVEKIRTKIDDESFLRYEQKSVEGLTKNEAIELSNNFGDKAIAVFNPSQSDIKLNCFANISPLYEYQYPYGYYYYKSALNGFAEISNDIVASLGYSVCGRLPVAYDEIAISKYVYEMFAISGYRNGEYILNADNIKSEFGFLSIEPKVDLLGKEYKIVGIVDTKFDTNTYNAAKGEKRTSNDYKLSVSFDAYVKCGLHSVAFVSQGYADHVSSQIKEAYCTNTMKVEAKFAGYSDSTYPTKVYDFSGLDNNKVVEICPDVNQGVVISYMDAILLATKAGRNDITDDAKQIADDDRYTFAVDKLVPFLDGLTVSIDVSSQSENLANATCVVSGILISDEKDVIAVNSSIYETVKSGSTDYTRVFVTYSGVEQVKSLLAKKTADGAEYCALNEIGETVLSVGQIIRPLGKIFLLASLIALVLSILFASNVIVSFINDKTNTIGVLRAMGGSVSDIYGIFATQSGLIMSIAFVLSIIISATIDAIINSSIGKAYGVSVRVLSYSGREFGIVFALVIAITVVATLVPIAIIDRKKPAELIRTE